MKKNIVFLFFIIFCLPTSTKAQMIINESPSYFTLIQSNGNKIEVDPFFGVDFKSSQDSVCFYVLELQTDGLIESKGFCYMIKEDEVFHLGNLSFVPVFLENTMDEEILVEYYKYAFIMHPKEKKMVRNIYITHDLVVEIKISYLIGEENLVEVKDGSYIATMHDGQIVIKL